MILCAGPVFREQRERKRERERTRRRNREPRTAPRVSRQNQSRSSLNWRARARARAQSIARFRFKFLADILLLKRTNLSHDFAVLFRARCFAFDCCTWQSCVHIYSSRREGNTPEITSPGYFQSKIRSPALRFHCDSVGIDRVGGEKGWFLLYGAK